MRERGVDRGVCQNESAILPAHVMIDNVGMHNDALRNRMGVGQATAHHVFALWFGGECGVVRECCFVQCEWRQQSTMLV